MGRDLVRSLLLMILLLGGVAWGPATTKRVNAATRSGRTITLHPLNAKFVLPRAWISWYQSFHNNLHLTPKELESVRDGQGEWDTEYARVVNSVLPFRECVAHLGGEGWGKESSSFA